MAGVMDDTVPSIEVITDVDIEEAVNADANAQFSINNFALVLFDSIPKSYQVNQNIECHFIITKNMQPTTSDWVGLYKVGWSSLRNYMTYEWVPPIIKDDSSDENLRGSVKFLATYLPKDDGAFYQFCYVACNDHIRGASTPFQFKRVTIDDIIEIVDKNEELMIVQSRATSMEEELKKVSDEQKNLQRAKNKLEKEKDQLQRQYENILSLLDDERKEHCQYIEKLQGYKHELEIANQRAKYLKEENEHLVATISQLTLTNEDLKHTVSTRAQDLVVLEQDIKKLIDEKNFLNGEIKVREEDLSVLKKKLHESEETYKLLNATYTSQLSTDQNKTKQKEQNILILEEEILTLKKNHDSEMKENKDLIVRLQQNVIIMETQCKAAEKCQEMLTDELSAYSALREKLTMDIEKSQGEAHSLKLQLSKLEETHKKDLQMINQNNTILQMEVEDLRKNNSQLKETLDEKQNELTKLQGQTLERSAQFILKQANESLQKQYNDLAKQFSFSTEKRKLLEAKESHLHKEVHDLKERLCRGAKEWQTKYLECQTLKKKLSQNSRNFLHSSRENLIAGDYSNHDDGFVDSDEESVVVVHRSASKIQRAPFTKHSSLSSSSSSSSVVQVNQLPCNDTAKPNDLDHVVIATTPKKENYHYLYKIQQDRCASLEHQLIEKENKFQDEVKRQESLCQNIKLEYQQKLQDLQRSNENNEIEISELRAVVQRLRLEQEDARSTPVAHSPTPVPPSRNYSHFPTIYGNPYANEIIPNSTVTVVRLTSDTFTDIVSSSDDGLSLDNLPPPLQAIELPSSKIAAITAVSRQMSPSVSVTVDTSEFEVFTDGDNDADRSSSISPKGSISRSSSFITNSDHGFELAPEEVEPSFRLCPVCATRFSSNTPYNIFEDHVYTHYGPICPMCNVQFSTDFSHGDFIRHVHGHFED